MNLHVQRLEEQSSKISVENGSLWVTKRENIGLSMNSSRPIRPYKATEMIAESMEE